MIAVTYDSEQEAFNRVARLRTYGIWPGVRRARHAAGFELTTDPDISGERHRGRSDDITAAPGAVSGANLICPPSDQAQHGGKPDLPPESTGEERP